MNNTLINLINGYKKFKKNYYEEKNPLFEQLIKYGQQPKTLVVSCSDSRVDPALILNAKPGDLFVIRNVANLIPHYENDNTFHGTSAALEFGIQILKIQHLIILGHTHCSGIESLINQSLITSPTTFLTHWMQLAAPAYEIVQEKYTTKPLDEQKIICGKYALINSLKNLETFPWIKEKIISNHLSIYGWYLDLSTGIISSYNKDNNSFEDLQ